jgi:hypothetical protein
VSFSWKDYSSVIIYLLLVLILSDELGFPLGDVEEKSAESKKASWELIEDQINSNIGLKKSRKESDSLLIDVKEEKAKEKKKSKLHRISKRLERNRSL